ncbi:MAG: tRNA dihydrouridine(20/20a) synthase DusA [Lactobacillales bacterium]|jgi:tRNA-dihydrouridine synthase A|nr:tRNA dihydrouridine(20/20a) synthase DusA [Lactobacillales bacterium]
MKQKQEKNVSTDKISIAPMLDWTDRHFRYFLRLICRRAQFYTEMVACPAIILGDPSKLLSFSPAEQPLVLQVGGSEPRLMGQCALRAQEYGYVGVNINAGCPSSRVQSGRFGAVLMKTPEIVAECVQEMRARSALPVSVKTRIALAEDGGDGFEHLFRFASLVKQAGCDHLIVHARWAKLNWSPKENRSERLPLDYETVYRLKKSFPDMFISLNGNVLSLEAAQKHLAHVDGVMIGRWAYGNPYALREVDALFYGDDHAILNRIEVLEKMMPYLEQNAAHLSIIMPHLMGLYHGQANSKLYKQTLMKKDLAELRAFINTQV